MNNPESTSKDEFVLLGDAAKYLHITPQTMRRWRKDGRLPAPVGFGKLGYWRSSLNAFLQKPPESNQSAQS
jgi:predicted site-specific integrase-resolvase